MNFRRIAVFALVLLAGCARFQPRPISPGDTAARLESRSLEDPAFKTFLEKSLQRQFDVWPLKSWDFDTLALAAYYYHPSLAVARTQWEEARGSEKTAAQRPNPTLNAIPGYDFTATSIGINPWIPAVSIDVPFETAGKRGYRKAQARHLSNLARLNIFTAAWQARSHLRTSLIDYTSARERDKLLEKQKDLQQKLLISLNQQLQAGAVSASDVTLQRIALAKGQLDLADARRQFAEAQVSVADAVGIPVKAIEGLTLEFDLAAPHPVAAELMSAEARGLALTNRADIRGALADYAASQSALQLEIAKQYPDIHLGPGYQFNNGDHQFTLALTVELPIFNQNQGPIAEAEARRATAAARFNELQARVITEIDRAVADYHVSQENLSVLELLAAEQEKRNASVAAQVQAGAENNFTLLNSQVELAASELVRLDGQVKAQQAFGALEDAVQRPVDTVKPIVIEQRAMKENKW